MTHDEDPGTAFLVVRAWRHPDGPLCTRIVADADPDPAHWETCVGVDPALRVVKTWLHRQEGLARESPAARDR